MVHREAGQPSFTHNLIVILPVQQIKKGICNIETKESRLFTEQNVATSNINSITFLHPLSPAESPAEPHQMTFSSNSN